MLVSGWLWAWEAAWIFDPMHMSADGSRRGGDCRPCIIECTSRISTRLFSPIIIALFAVIWCCCTFDPIIHVPGISFWLCRALPRRAMPLRVISCQDMPSGIGVFGRGIIAIFQIHVIASDRALLDNTCDAGMLDSNLVPQGVHSPNMA